MGPEPHSVAFLSRCSIARSRRSFIIPEFLKDLVKLVQDLLRRDLLVAVNVADEPFQLGCDGQFLPLCIIIPSVASFCLLFYLPLPLHLR